MADPLRIDIVSDVVCPWCVIGYRQLEQAVAAEGVDVEIHWHPFELNPNMPAEGQNLREHLAEKYGSTDVDSAEVRARLTALGAELGFDFRYSDDMRMRNTFRAHQLIHWAEEFGKDHDLKQALFMAYFTKGRDVNDASVLADIAGSVGLDQEDALSVIAEDRFAAEVRGLENFWISKGIRGVPAMIFDSRHLVTGARGVEAYRQVIRQVAAETAA